MKTTQTLEQPNAETVWAILREIAEQQKEYQRELAEQQKEWKRELAEQQKVLQKENAEREEKYAAERAKRQKEIEQMEQKYAAESAEREKKYAEERAERENKYVAERVMLQKEVAEVRKDTDKRLGKLGNRLGEMVEYMVMPNLITKFRELGFVFTEAYPHAVIDDEEHNILAEIDITLKNGDKVMIVEVKNKLTTEDVTEHIERMKKVRAHADLHNDKRVYLGAVAGMVMNKNEKLFALKNGFYVIEPSGETFIITVPDGIYSPKEW